MRRKLISTLALLSLVLPGCATVNAAAAPADRAAVLLSTKAPPRSSCTVATQPSRLPSVDQVADSAALSAAVSALSREQRIGGSDVFLLLSVGFDRSGAVQWVRPVDWYLPEGAAEQMRALVSSRLRPQAHGDWSIRLRVVPGATPTFTVGRSEICPPEGVRTVQLNLPVQFSQLSPSAMRVRALIGTRGELLGAEQEASSGNVDLDRWVVRELANSRYGPGLVDGIPTVMPLEQTIQFTQRINSRP